MNIALLTSPGQWMESHVRSLSERLGGAEVYLDHNAIPEGCHLLFILGYHQLVPSNVLNKHKHNIVVHESELPKGKGWSPLFWQILEGQCEIVFTMFEANSDVDDGDIYMRDTLHLTGLELNDELRRKQAEKTIEMCMKFVDKYEQYSNPKKQIGSGSYYRKRSPEDSCLDIKKTIEQQFNLLRIVNNDEYPAFFRMHGNKYILKIEIAEDE